MDPTEGAFIPSQLIVSQSLQAPKVVAYSVPFDLPPIKGPVWNESLRAILSPERTHLEKEALQFGTGG